MNDQDIQIGQLRKGELRPLYDQFAPVLYGMALRMVRNDALAAKVLEKTFLHLRDKRSEFDQAKENLCTWMMGVLRNYAREYMAQIPPDYSENQMLPDSVNGKDMTATVSINSVRSRILDMIVFGPSNTKDAAIKLGLPENEIRQLLREAIFEYRNEPSSAPWK